MSNKIGTIEKLMDGYNPMRQRMEETRGLVKKWEPTGLLEGLKDEQKVHGMSVLLENQARQLIDEASATQTSANSPKIFLTNGNATPDHSSELEDVPV